jgi:hypothetical protein
MDLHRLWVNVTSDSTTVLVLSPFAILIFAFMLVPPVFLWRLRYSSLKKAREMATGLEDGVIAFTVLLVINLFLGVILRPLVLRRFPADALTFGLLLVDFFGSYYVVVVFARIWIAKRRVRQLEAQPQEKSF